MSPVEVRSSSPSFARGAVAFVIAYVVSRAIFAALGFHYALFGEPFSAHKVVTSLGVWIVVYGLALVLVGWRVSWSRT